jgi:hypothetical protein
MRCSAKIALTPCRSSHPRISVYLQINDTGRRMERPESFCVPNASTRTNTRLKTSVICRLKRWSEVEAVNLVASFASNCHAV